MIIRYIDDFYLDGSNGYFLPINIIKIIVCINILWNNQNIYNIIGAAILLIPSLPAQVKCWECDGVLWYCVAGDVITRLQVLSCIIKDVAGLLHPFTIRLGFSS